MSFPVLQRELLVRARMGFTYLLRTGTALIGGAAVVFIWGLHGLASTSTTALGQEIFMALLYLLMAVALLEGVRSSALSVVSERTEGTLGLLFLTDLSSREILAGKVASQALSSVLALLGAAPLLMLPLLLGGVDFATSMAGIVVVLNSLLLSLACGTLASVWCRKNLTAFATAYGMIIAVVALPMLVRLLDPRLYNSVPQSIAKFILLANPVIAADFVARWSSRAGWPAEFWLAQIVVGLFSIGALFAAARLLDHTWLAGKDLVATAPKTPRRNIDDLLHGLGQRFARLSRWVPPPADPLSRSLAARLNVNRWLPVLMALMLVQAFIYGASTASNDAGWAPFLASAVVFFVARLLFCHIAVQTFAEGRSSGEMEILLTTPLEDRQLVHALWYLLRRLIGWTLAAGIVGELLVLLGRLSASNPEFLVLNSPEEIVLVLLSNGLDLVGEAVSMAATAWLGLWFGLKSRNTAVAVAKTFGWMTVLPTAVALTLAWLVEAEMTASAFVGTNDPWPRFMSTLVGNVILAFFAIGYHQHAKSRLYARFRQTIAQG